jgi:methylenetetrahydrofolate reductase (NADPH)
LTEAPADLLRRRLARREWIVMVETVTPPAADEAARDRILALADAVGPDDRVAALTLTDRTTAPDADPLALAPAVAARSGKGPLVHLAGKGRPPAGAAAALRRTAGGESASVLLTGGDRLEGARLDALELLRLARETARALLPLAVIAPAPDRLAAEAWGRAAAKRDAGAAALVAQVSWDLGVRETVGAWPARLGVPILGAVMLVTRGRLAFLGAHGITGIVVPAALRRRVEAEPMEAALRRLALDVVLLRRLGYAGAHVSGLATPSRVAALLDEAARLDAALADGWRRVWREAVGIA